MYRAIYFVFIILIPVIFSWWLFIPMALLLVYLARVPYEIIFAAIILDAAYYLGDGILGQNKLTIFALITIILAIIINSRVHWRKII